MSYAHLLLCCTAVLRAGRAVLLYKAAAAIVYADMQLCRTCSMLLHCSSPCWAWAARARPCCCRSCLLLLRATCTCVIHIPTLAAAPQFSVLGVGCAGAAVLLYEGVRVSEVVLRPLPRWVSAPLGGAVCGLIAFKFPQVRC